MQSEGVLEGVRVTMTSSPGQRQSHQISPGRGCWTHLYPLCLSSIPALHHSSTHPLGCRWTDDPRAGMLCHPFANREIVFQLLKFKPWRSMFQLASEIPLQGPECQKGVRSGSSPRPPVVCLGKDRTLWNHSFHWQPGFRLQPGPDKATTLVDILRSF